jgi:hypothetical protein
MRGPRGRAPTKGLGSLRRAASQVLGPRARDTDAADSPSTLAHCPQSLYIPRMATAIHHLSLSLQSPLLPATGSLLLSRLLLRPAR